MNLHLRERFPYRTKISGQFSDKLIVPIDDDAANPGMSQIPLTTVRFYTDE